MRKAIYPGSFDPFHLGHLDIIKRACKQLDEVIVVIGVNYLKQGMITPRKRRELIENSVKEAGLINVRVIVSDELIVDVCKTENVKQIIRSIRSITDYEYEKNIAAINKELNPEIETVMYFADPALSFISSSVVRELLHFNRDVSKYVPNQVNEYLREQNENL